MIKASIKTLPFIILAFAIVAGASYFAYYVISNQDVASRLIGGQKDVHGCLIAAGYSWCISEQRCIRQWEESCKALDQSDETTIKLLFAEKYHKSVSKINLIIEKRTEKYVRGGVQFLDDKGASGGGGNFFAAKIDNQWSLVFDGNGSFSCKDLKIYDFPENMQEGCTK